MTQHGLRRLSGAGAAPPYTKGPYVWDQYVQFSQGIGGSGVAVPEGSEIWYVDKNKTSGVSGTGKSWNDAFMTLTEAVAAAGAYDVIYMGRGYYQEAATIEITSAQRGLKIFGQTSGGVPTSNGLSSATSGDDILIINADDVEIAGITFWCLTNAKNGIDIGEDYDGYNNWIHDCCFLTGNADNDLGEYGIKVNNTDDCVGTLIENNLFYFMSTAGVVSGCTRCTIRNNTIWSNSIGLDLTAHTGGTHSGLAVMDNYLIGRQSGSTIGIKLAATEPTDGHIFIANNVVTNFNTNITTGKAIESIVNSQTAADASSYLQVDTSP